MMRMKMKAAPAKRTKMRRKQKTRITHIEAGSGDISATA
jgi:hypothetical protein